MLPPIRGRRLRLASIPMTATALFVMMVILAGVPAAGDQAETELEPVGLLVPDDELDARILALDLESSAYRAAVDRLESSLFAREQGRRRLDRVESTGTELRHRSVDLATQISDSGTAIETAVAELDRIEFVLATRAVERFVRHGTDIDALLDPTASIDAGRGALLSAEVDDAQIELRAGLLGSIAELEELLDSLRAELVFTDISIAITTELADDLVDDVSRLEEDVERAEDQVAAARRSARVVGMGLGVIALDAYMDAETSLAETDPGCRFEWWMVAGVARVESRHGELDGRRVRADGSVDRPIIGVALDGGPSVQLVRDTDDGRLDEDADFDRAVGPLQFIPETWGRLGRDGNGDGVLDPQNIYDAALAAGTYLCRLASDLSIGGALRRAYYGYNASAEYVDAVHRHAVRYAELEVERPE